jgi:3-oxoisoapionate kinase
MLSACHQTRCLALVDLETTWTPPTGRESSAGRLDPVLGMSNLLLSFYGDDFTGSTDALESLAKAGVKAVLFMRTPSNESLARHRGIQAVGMAGLTRAMDPETMANELRPALIALRSLGAPHVHYKVCSTFDSSPGIGSIGRVIDLGAEIFRSKFVPVLAAAPALGRHCVFGNLFARVGIGSDGAIHRLDRHPVMSRHPVTPMDEADLRQHLAKQTNKRIGLFDILHVALPEAESKEALERMLAERPCPEAVLIDALDAEHMANIGALLDAHASLETPLLTVGSSGVGSALTAHWTRRGSLEPVTNWPEPGAASPLLVISGSCSSVTAGQIEWAVASGFAEVALDTTALVSKEARPPIIMECLVEARKALQQGRSVVIHTSRGGDDPRVAATVDRLVGAGATGTARLLGTVLGGIARELLADGLVRRLCIAGGDTSGHAAKILGIEALEMLAPLTPGAPICRATAPNSCAEGLEVVFKGGQVGAPDFFGVVHKGRA